MPFSRPPYLLRFLKIRQQKCKTRLHYCHAKGQERRTHNAKINEINKQVQMEIYEIVPETEKLETEAFLQSFFSRN